MISNDEFHRSISEQINSIFKVINKLHDENYGRYRFFKGRSK